MGADTAIRASDACDALAPTKAAFTCGAQEPESHAEDHSQVRGGDGKGPLPTGARIFVYIPQTGYVAVGETTGEALPFDEATITIDGTPQPLLEQQLHGTYHHANEIAEYVVPVRWIHTRPAKDAIRGPGLFANQNSACRLRSSFTIETLTKAFDLDT